jgi:hypothetical protein
VSVTPVATVTADVMLYGLPPVVQVVLVLIDPATSVAEALRIPLMVSVAATIRAIQVFSVFI